MTDPPSRKRSAVLIVGIIGVVLVVGGAALFARNRSSVNSPDGVREAYMAAYEQHDFREVVEDACSTYKRDFGTDTSTLEQNIQAFEVTATADGEPALRGDAATADITLEVSQGSTTEQVPIFIRIQKEGGVWRFCGEGRGEPS